MSNTTYRSTTRDAADELSNMANDATDAAAKVADNVSDMASRVSERASAIGKKAVDQFSATTDYFREHDVNAIASDVKSWVKSNPTQALVAAAAVGFLAATLIRRR
jgi:ElaB/YqjD/DUF883 family membrane-anchored ribosome-binding protein